MLSRVPGLYRRVNKGKRRTAIVMALLFTSLAVEPALSQGAAEVQVLPNDKVMILNLQGTSEFCADPQDRTTCRVLERGCDFIVVDPRTKEISEPEPITAEAIAVHGGPGALPLAQGISELLPDFKFGENECNLAQASTGGEQGTENEPFAPPSCTFCEVPVSPGQP
jgi:hypothetical protein